MNIHSVWTPTSRAYYGHEVWRQCIYTYLSIYIYIYNIKSECFKDPKIHVKFFDTIKLETLRDLNSMFTRGANVKDGLDLDFLVAHK